MGNQMKVNTALSECTSCNPRIEPGTGARRGVVNRHVRLAAVTKAKQDIDDGLSLREIHVALDGLLRAGRIRVMGLNDKGSPIYVTCPTDDNGNLIPIVHKNVES